MERLSRALLGFAYIVSVAFYIRLMAAFVLGPFGGGDVEANILATAVLASIGTLRWWRGLRGLEALEEVAVDLKLAIIAGLIGGCLCSTSVTPMPLSTRSVLMRRLPDGGE